MQGNPTFMEQAIALATEKLAKLIPAFAWRVHDFVTSDASVQVAVAALRA